MRAFVLTALLLVVACGVVMAEERAPQVEKFRACENVAGGGIFWVDTTTGKAWRTEPGDATWIYAGRPEGAAPGPAGTYVPHKNKSGEGVFILNSATGEGWWTDGKAWKRLGMPRETAEAKK